MTLTPNTDATINSGAELLTPTSNPLEYPATILSGQIAVQSVVEARLPERSNGDLLLAAFEIDDSHLLDTFPEIRAFAELAFGVAQDIEDLPARSTELAHSMGLDTSRTVRRRRQEKITHPVVEMICALGRCAAATDDDTERSARMKATLEANFSFDRSPVIVDLWVSAANAHALIHKKHRESAPLVAEAAQAEVQTDAAAQYNLLKLIAGSKDASLRTDESSPREILTGMLCTVITDTEQGSLPDQLVMRLEKGDYDQFMARDLLVYSDNADDIPALAGLKTMMRLLKNCMPEYSVQDIHERLAQNIVLWPNDARLSLGEAKARLLQHLYEAINYTVRELKESGIMAQTNDTPEEELANAMRVARSAIQTNPQLTGAPMSSKHTIMKALATRKRGRRIPQAAAPEIASASVETIAEPREVVRIDRQGKTQDRTSPDFKDMIEDYLRQYKGSLGLPDDVERIVEYLSKIDFSKGILPGVKKYNSSIRLGDKIFDVYAFKVIDAVGMPTSNSRAKKIRVLFTLTDANQLGILALVDRDKVPTVERNLGIASSAKG